MELAWGWAAGLATLISVDTTQNSDQGTHILHRLKNIVHDGTAPSARVGMRAARWRDLGGKVGVTVRDLLATSKGRVPPNLG